MPDKFKKHIIYIAVGKWLGMGMVLCNPTHHTIFTKEGCGETVGTNTAEATKTIAADYTFQKKRHEERDS
eukprot:7347982-Ditylum_brightwellii.AAC.1